MATDKSIAQAVELAHGLHVLDDDAADWIAKKAAELDAQNGAAGEGEWVPPKKLPDDGNGDDDAYNAGWNACREAVLAAAPTPPDPAADVARGELVDRLHHAHTLDPEIRKLTTAAAAEIERLTRLTAGAGNGVDEAMVERAFAAWDSCGPKLSPREAIAAAVTAALRGIGAK